MVEDESTLRLESLQATAAVTVQRLADKLPLGALPEDDPGWSAAFVSAVRTLKEKFRGSPDLAPLLAIASEQLYGREIHWALELIQNAEDAGARRIVFLFEPDRVLVHNDGDEFSAADVWGICSAGHSPKKNKIGFFGIGFKSVSKLTNAPEIRSGPYAFRIQDKIYPEPLPPDGRRRRGARFVLPVRAVERGRLPSIIEELTGPEFLHLLLTLESLEVIAIVDRVTGRGRGQFYRRPGATDTRRGWEECRIGGSWQGCEEQTWRRYRYSTPAIPAGLARQGRQIQAGDTSTIVLARPLDRATTPPKLHCFLPLDVASELRWLVQADFDPTPGRERLRENDWNRWLLSEVGSVMASAIEAEARSGQAPWTLIPLAAEVAAGSLQRRAFDTAMSKLRDGRFVRTGAGWRTPSATIWAPDEAFRDVVREADLLAATGKEVSYVAGTRAPTRDPTEDNRMKMVIGALGGRELGIPDLLNLLTLDDEKLGRRDGKWWLQALHVIAVRATQPERLSIASTACIPTANGGRVKPSPRVTLTGYLVAYSRSATITDLRRYFTESEIHLVDPFLDPTSGARASRGRTQELNDIRTKVRDLLSKEPFGVALEAGPYHVVTDLILPRMAALAQVDGLDHAQREQLSRMVEFLRHRWRGYVSDYRRNRSAIDEARIARQLGERIQVATVVGQGRAARLLARPLTRTYLSSAMIGQDGMDIVLEGKRDRAVVDDTHATTIPVPRGRGIQRGTRAQMPPREFLRFLGGLVGPSVRKRAGDALNDGRTATYVNPVTMPWVAWPRSAGGRPAMVIDDWVSDDISWLADHWPTMSTRTRRRRARALWNVIQEDWERLAPTTKATPAHFYRSVVADPPLVASSWVGQLGTIAWVGALDKSLQSPRSLVRNTPATRLALATEAFSVLDWPTRQESMLVELGVAERPAAARIIETLHQLRDAQPGLTVPQRLRAAGACYELLAADLASLATDVRVDLTRTLIRPKFHGNGRTGLIFAPPPRDFSGREWWPPTRAVRDDVSAVAGPFVGQKLAGRFPRSAALWDALGIRTGLDAQVIGDIIRHELASNQDDEVTRHFYGELVLKLDSLLPDESDGPGDVPALTDQGWRVADQTWWTARPEIRSALATHLAWWMPGTYDASIAARAGRWLEVHELTAGEALEEQWSLVASGALRADLRDRWLAALRVWPEVLRSEGDWDRTVIAALTQVTAGLQPATALRIEGELTLHTAEHSDIQVHTEPRVLLRDGVLVGLDPSDLFGYSAADTLGSLVQRRQLAARNALAVLLMEAFGAPDDFSRRVAPYAATAADTLTLLPTFDVAAGQDDADAEQAAIEVIRHASAPMPVSGPKQSQARPPSHTERRFADPALFELLAFERRDNQVSGPVGEPEPYAAPRRRAPRPESERPTRQPGDAATIPPNTAVEDAARPYVEMFEARRGGFAIHRQGALVGADYVASDGRYIEVKASGGVAADAFTLEASEWGAALDRDLRHDYWVYVVEHLTDGGTPELTAIFNPARDPQLRQAPVGKMRVSGWRRASRQVYATFRRRDGSG